MTWRDYDNLQADLQWLRSEHPERKTLIEFVERFRVFVQAELTKEGREGTVRVQGQVKVA
jgi:hypothetical protein